MEAPPACIKIATFNVGLQAPSDERLASVADTLLHDNHADITVITEIPRGLRFAQAVRAQGEALGKPYDFQTAATYSRLAPAFDNEEYVGVLLRGEGRRFAGLPEAVGSAGRKVHELMMAKVAVSGRGFTVLGGRYDPLPRTWRRFYLQCEQTAELLAEAQRQMPGQVSVLAANLNAPGSMHQRFFHRRQFVRLTPNVATVPDVEGHREVGGSCARLRRVAAMCLGRDEDVIYVKHWEQAGLAPVTGSVYATGTSRHKFVQGSLLVKS